MRVMHFISFLLISLLCVTAQAGLPFSTVFKGTEKFETLVSQAELNQWKTLPIGERTATVGRAW